MLFFLIIFDILIVEFVAELQRVILWIISVLLISIFGVLVALLDCKACFWVLVKNLFSSHVEFLEEEIGLSCCNHVVLLTLNQLTSLKLEELFILVLSFLNVVSERLRFNTSSDHLLLITAEFFISEVTWNTVVLFFEVLGVFKRGCPVEIGVKGSLHVGQLSLHWGVPVVFNGVVSATLEDFGNFCPLVIYDSVHKEKDPLLFLTPVNLLDKWVQMVVPSLSALLAHSVLQMLSNECPFLWSISDYKLKHSPVLFLSPCTLDVGDLVLFRHLLNKIVNYRLNSQI